MKKCMCCMRDYSESSDACPVCGYSEQQMEADAKEHAEALHPETILQGRFILGRVLDMSDFSIIYIAWDALLSRRVVIREYFPLGIGGRDTGSGEIKAFSVQDQLRFEKGSDVFEEENKILSKNQDLPQLINIYRTFRENGTIYCVMQYLEGCTLQDYLDTHPDLDADQRKALFRKVVDAVGVVHERGIVHFNLAPENIYLNEEEQVTLIDFGAAKRAIYDLKEGDIEVFDDRYSAPELLSGAQASSAADLYSLGAICYQLETGKFPPKSPGRAKKRTGLKVKNSDAAAAMIDLLTNPDPMARPGSIAQFKKTVGWR